MDPTDGYFAWLPNTHLALYRNDLPLLIHTKRVPVEYGLLSARLTRGEAFAADQPSVQNSRKLARAAMRASTYRHCRLRRSSSWPMLSSLTTRPLRQE